MRPNRILPIRKRYKEALKEYLFANLAILEKQEQYGTQDELIRAKYNAMKQIARNHNLHLGILIEEYCKLEHNWRVSPDGPWEVV